MEDRFGPPPPEAQRFVQLMRLKTELRRLRVLGCEASAKSVTLHLRDDTPLDPAKLTALVTKRGSPYRVTPDMRVTRRMTEHDVVADGLGAADKMLAELALCGKDETRRSEPAARTALRQRRARLRREVVARPQRVGPSLLAR